MSDKPKEELRYGDLFRLHGRLCHFVGTLMDGDEVLYTYWYWNRYSRQRIYRTLPGWSLDIDFD